MPAWKWMSILQPVAEGCPDTHVKTKVKFSYLYALGM